MKEFVLELAPLVVAFAGVVVTGVLSYLLYESGKTSPYREQLYSKQVEAFRIVLPAFCKLHDGLVTVIDGLGPELNDNNRPTIAGMIMKEMLAFVATMYEWGFVLPNEFIEETHNYLALLWDFRHNEDLSGEPKQPIDSQVAKSQAIRLYGMVMNAARSNMGIHKLSEKTLNILRSI